MILIVPINAEEWSDRFQQSDSLELIIEDFSGFLNDIEIDSLYVLLKAKKNITQQLIFSLTGDHYASYVISKYSDAGRFNGSAGISSDAMRFINAKYHAMMNGRFKRRHSYSLIIEKDRMEENGIDNVKGYYQFSPNIIIGNIRLKTGRGLFSDYSNYYSLSSIPFYSMRFEGDGSRDEYPSFRGIGLVFPFADIRTYMLLSFNQYDARIENDTVLSIMTYNIHDDSLSLSRKDNLDEYAGALIAGHKSGVINAGFLYSQNAFPLKPIDANHYYTGSVFGHYDIYSYDIAYSSNGGYALSAALKKTYKREITFKANYLRISDYFNPHSKLASLVNRDKFSFSFRLHRPVGILYENIFEFGDRYSVKHYITLYPVNFFHMVYAFDQTDYSSRIKLKIRSVNSDDFIMYNSFKLTSQMSLSIRSDIQYVKGFMKTGIFIYYFSTQEDMLSEYEFTASGTYAQHNIYDGSGFRGGINIVIGLHSNISLSAGYAGNFNNDHLFAANLQIMLK